MHGQLILTEISILRIDSQELCETSDGRRLGSLHGGTGLGQMIIG